MHRLIKCLDKKLDKNSITLKNLSDLEQNFDCLLDKQDSVHYLNCHDLNITFSSKLNFISFKNCSNIILHINSVISGIEIINSSNITVYGNNINSLTAKKSNVVVYQPKKIRKKTMYENFHSSLKVITLSQ